MLNFPQINNKTSSSNELLYNPLTDSLTQDEISKYLDEFNPNMKTPNSKKSQKISDSPFVERLNEIANFVYRTPTPHKIVGSVKKSCFSKTKTKEKRKSPSFGGGQENKENMTKSTAKFKCCRGSFEFFGSGI